jgi:hypothetical protein
MIANNTEGGFYCMASSLINLIARARLLFNWSPEDHLNNISLLIDKDKSIFYSNTITEKNRTIAVDYNGIFKMNTKENRVHNYININGKVVPTSVSAVWYAKKKFKKFIAYGTVMYNSNSYYRIEVFDRKSGNKVLSLNANNKIQHLASVDINIVQNPKDNTVLYMAKNGLFKAENKDNAVVVTTYDLSGDSIKTRKITLRSNIPTRSFIIDDDKLFVIFYIYSDTNKKGKKRQKLSRAVLYTINTDGTFQKQKFYRRIITDSSKDIPGVIRFFHGKLMKHMYFTTKNAESNVEFQYTHVWDSAKRRFVPVLILPHYAKTTNRKRSVNIMSTEDVVHLDKALTPFNEKVIYHYKNIYITRTCRDNNVYFHIYRNGIKENTLKAGEFVFNTGKSVAYNDPISVSSAGKKGRYLYIAHIGEVEENGYRYRKVVILKYDTKTRHYSGKKLKTLRKKDSNITQLFLADVNFPKYDIFNMLVANKYNTSFKYIRKDLSYFRNSRFTAFKMKVYSDNLFKIGNFLLAVDSVNKKFEFSPSFTVKNGHFLMVHDSVIRNRLSKNWILYDSKLIGGDVRTGEMHELPVETLINQQEHITKSTALNTTLWSVIPNVVGNDASKYAYLVGARIKEGLFEKKILGTPVHKLSAYMKNAFIYRIDMENLKAEKMIGFDYNAVKKVFNTANILGNLDIIQKNNLLNLMIDTNYMFISPVDHTEPKLFGSSFRDYIYIDDNKNMTFGTIKNCHDSNNPGWLPVNLIVLKNKVLHFPKSSLKVKSVSIIKSFFAQRAKEKTVEEAVER